MTITLSEIAQLIAALSAFGAFVLSWHNSMKIKEVHEATNSMKDALVEEVRAASLAEGIKQGREEMR